MAEIDIVVEKGEGTRYKITRRSGHFSPFPVMSDRHKWTKEQADAIKQGIEAAYRCGQEDVKASLRHLIDVAKIDDGGW